jgi:uncharacterized protein (TIGR03084 family)
MDPICADFLDECAVLDDIVAALSEAQWSLPTPAEGWSVRDQISHLWFFDQRARLALDEPDEFAADRSRLAEAHASADVSDVSVEQGRTMSLADLLDAWRRDRRRLAASARAVDPSMRVPWYGPSMSARSFLTARLMEAWAHGQDVADCVGAQRQPSSRLRHVAHLGVRARPYSYAVNARPVPSEEVAVRLDGPDGAVWSWGDSEHHVISGTALDFCLVVTRRRHWSDVALRIDGAAAREWIDIAQAFAGGPGSGRSPGQFR